MGEGKNTRRNTYNVILCKAWALAGGIMECSCCLTFLILHAIWFMLLQCGTHCNNITKLQDATSFIDTMLKVNPNVCTTLLVASTSSSRISFHGKYMYIIASKAFPLQ